MLICPSFALDPGPTRNPSESKSGLGWVCVCISMPSVCGQSYPLRPCPSLLPTLPGVLCQVHTTSLSLSRHLADEKTEAVSACTSHTTA